MHPRNLKGKLEPYDIPRQFVHVGDMGRCLRCASSTHSRCLAHHASKQRRISKQGTCQDRPAAKISKSKRLAFEHVDPSSDSNSFFYIDKHFSQCTFCILQWCGVLESVEWQLQFTRSRLQRATANDTNTLFNLRLKEIFLPKLPAYADRFPQ